MSEESSAEAPKKEEALEVSALRRTRARARVIGCGRSFRRDDQVGLLIAEAIASALSGPVPHIEVVATEAPGAELFDGLCDGDLLVIIDAARARNGFPLGAWTRIDYRATPERIGDKCRTNTHTLSVDAALELADRLGTLPSAVWVYAVAAVCEDQIGYGEDLTPEVQCCIPKIAQQIRGDVEQWLAQGNPG